MNLQKIAYDAFTDELQKMAVGEATPYVLGGTIGVGAGLGAGRLMDLLTQSRMMRALGAKPLSKKRLLIGTLISTLIGAGTGAGAGVSIAKIQKLSKSG